MQKSSLEKLCYFLVVQATYSSVECALFQGGTILDTHTEDKKSASALLIPSLDSILKRNDLSLDDITCIVVNRGPAPFTTLRTVIASANGLSFARHIPLIGVDGLHALLAEYTPKLYPNTVALLNAFSQDVYFGIRLEGKLIKTGYANINTLLEELKRLFIDQEQIYFAGNGASLYEKKIREQFAKRVIISERNLSTCSIQQVGLMGLQQWQKQKELIYELLPLYLKTKM